MAETRETIIKKMLEAEKLLIGIGEEFSCDNVPMDGYKPYEVFLKKREEQDCRDKADWLLEYIRACYLEDKSIAEKLSVYKAYKSLYEKIKDKDYYIVSMNHDPLLQMAGFSAERTVSPCGDRSLLQCGQNCASLVWTAEPVKQDILNQILDPDKELLLIDKPICGVCGRDAEFNIVSHRPYAESGYKEQWEKYTKWTSCTLNKDICIAELGVGFQYPTVIRWPFEKIAYYNHKAYFIRVNEKLWQLSEELEGKSTAIRQNSLQFVLE